MRRNDWRYLREQAVDARVVPAVGPCMGCPNTLAPVVIAVFPRVHRPSGQHVKVHREARFPGATRLTIIICEDRMRDGKALALIDPVERIGLTANALVL